MMLNFKGKMMKRIMFVLLLCVFIVSCGSHGKLVLPSSQELRIVVDSATNSKVDISSDFVSRSMEVHNPEGRLSELSFVSKDRAFVKIFSGLSVSDVTRLWNDLCVLEHDTNIRDVELFINSPGGDAFSGLALADQIERAQRKGFVVTAHASGIIASAAVPVFVVCKKRIAAPGTIFMVHEAELWKWPGRETASDIRSQNELMCLLRDRYIGKLVANSKLDKPRWEELENKTTWFSAEQAMKWGLVDEID